MQPNQAYGNAFLCVIPSGLHPELVWDTEMNFGILTLNPGQYSYVDPINTTDLLKQIFI